MSTMKIRQRRQTKTSNILLLLFLLPSWTFAFTSTSSSQKSYHKNNLPVATASSLASHSQSVQAEVVGAAGRIGSLFLTEYAKPIPKGIAPGCWSNPNTPIFVTTPAKAWPQILADTIEDRRQDLVWIGNGLPPTDCSSCTIVVPHFGVLQVNADPITSDKSPPTFLYGKHAQAVEKILKDRGIRQIEIVESYDDIMVAAAQKLLWAASMWLLCHKDKENPITALQVHTIRKDELEALVRDELVPALNERLSTSIDADTALDYMLRYSQSMPQAIPNLQLAKSEWNERNAFFLNVRDQVPQPKHEALLKRVGGIKEEDIETAGSAGDMGSLLPTDQQSTRIKTEIPSLGFTLVGNSSSNRRPAQTAIVVGSGILGSSTALHLARQGCQPVTVVDVQSSSKQLGTTTPASWAWLNANGKSPPIYAWLNQLGMEAWRRDTALNHLPTWCGSLVRCLEKPACIGGYRCEGPLNQDRLVELEPEADFRDKDNSKDSDASVYYYPEEGFVDPSVAVQTIRKEATQLGVQFLTGHNVTGFTRNDAGAISGIQAESGGKTVSFQADVVVLAAGIGSTSLAKIPLLHRPGQIAFARPASETVQLQRILVDTVRESHVLQRQDGSLVVGGGALEVGGVGATALTTNGPSQDDDSATQNVHPLLATAQKLVPGAIGELSRTEQAMRPIPLDGLPAVGFLAPGLFSVISHSGVTLSPVLAALAATEMAKGVDIEALETFRPARFFPPA